MREAYSAMTSGLALLMLFGLGAPGSAIPASGIHHHLRLLLHTRWESKY